jgi:Protein of unknown function (DUF2917)
MEWSECYRGFPQLHTEAIMITNLTSTKVDLARSGLLNIEAQAGLTVACESGLVWVTVEGERADHWLVAGDALSVAWPGRVVVEAAQASRVALQEPEKSAWQFRWMKFGRRATPQCAA